MPKISNLPLTDYVASEDLVAIVQEGETRRVTIPTLSSFISNSQLELIDEDGNTGWRLFGKNPDFHSTIGQDAIDLTHSSVPSAFNGASGDYSLSTGYNTQASGYSSSAHGFSTKTSTQGAMVTGKFNEGKATSIFEIGIGQDDISRTNALEVTVSGEIIAPNFLIENITSPKALVTKEFMESNSGVSQVQAYLESGNTGWRLIGRSGAFYGDIGEGAVDFALSTEMDGGMKGNYSFGVGENISSSENHSFVTGRFNEDIVGAIFEIGIGTSNLDKRNVLTAFRDGRLTTRMSISQIDTSPQSLITKEYLDQIVIDCGNI